MDTPTSGDSRGLSRKTRPWLGGYVRAGKRGPCFIIERWIDGHRYHVSTKCRTERAALAQLAEFEADPPNYKPGRASREATGAKRLEMTADLVTGYFDWLLSRPQPTTKHHAKRLQAHLKKWMIFFSGRDIRTVKPRELSEYLAGLTARPMRTQALKGFCSWLRKEKFLLERNEDPSIDLNTPPRRAQKDARQVAVEPERLLKVLAHLPERAADVMLLRLGSGWHISECVRFAREGEIRPTPGKFVWLETGEGPVKVPLLATLHVRQLKSRTITNTPIIHEEHLRAAERIRAAGATLHPNTLAYHTKNACAKAGVAAFWNWHIRHSVVSYASEEGADLEHVSTFIDHFGIHTDRKHYRQIPLPKKVVPVLRAIDGGKKSAS